MADNNEPLFPENAMVAIVEKNSTEEIKISTDIDSFSISGGGRPIDIRNFFKGAKVKIKQSQEPFEVTMNAKIQKPIFDQMMQGGDGETFVSGGDQKDYRVTFCVTTDPTAIANNDANSAIAALYDTYRIVFAEATMTGFEPSLEADGMLEGEATFEIAAKDDNGVANLLYNIGTGGFGAIGNFSDAQKWDAIVATNPVFASARVYNSSTIEVTFSKAMSDPTGKQAQFAVEIAGSEATETAVELKAGDSSKFLITVSDTITTGQAVLVTYTPGDITSTDAAALTAFTDETVTNGL